MNGSSWIGSRDDSMSSNNDMAKIRPTDRWHDVLTTADAVIFPLAAAIVLLVAVRPPVARAYIEPEPAPAARQATDWVGLAACITALAALLNAATSSLRTWRRLERERRAGETGPIDAPSSGCRRLADGKNKGGDARRGG